MPLWLELRPANDTDWRRLDEDEASLVAAEERARAMIVCKIVTPEGIRIVWSPEEERSPARRLSAVDVAEFALAGGRRG